MSDDINLECIKNTQKILGKFVKKPALTEKLLRKPPFRFLHDIITNVIRETGFLRGLYSEEELISDNVKEKEAKIKFLTKLIDEMKSITGKEIRARPSKIVAGLEPTETNNLLQAIGRALDKKLNSTDNNNTKKDKKTHLSNNNNKVEKKKTIRDASVEGKNSKTSSKNSTPRKIDSDSKKTKIKDNLQNSKLLKSDKNNIRKNDDEKKIEIKKENLIQKRDEEIIRENEKTEIKMEKNDQVQIKNNHDHNISENVEIKENEDENMVKISTKTSRKEISENDVKQSVGALLKRENTTIVRPKSAKPKVSALRRDKDRNNLPTGFIERKIELENNQELTDVEELQRPPTSLRPPSVRPSSARPGAPRLKQDPVIPTDEVVPLGKVKVIVEDFDKNKDVQDDDDDNVVTVEMVLPTFDAPTRPLDLPSDKGHLVEQILEQLHDEGDKNVPQVEIEWNQDDLKNNSVNKELENVRNTLQNLTKYANPLGKMMGYLHEDIDAMHTELNMWVEARKTAEKEIEEQKRVSNEEQKPLLGELDILKENVEKYKKYIATAQATIMQNEQRIQKLILG